MSTIIPTLIPQPKKIILSKGDPIPWPRTIQCRVDDRLFDQLKPALESIFKQLETITGTVWQPLEQTEPSHIQSPCNASIQENPHLPPQGYQLSLQRDAITIHSPDAIGAYYALQSLIQIARLNPSQYPLIEIDDAPSVLKRGYMLDISRNKVPTIESLKSLIDCLSALKYNQLQLYTEHTFAFSKHKRVWENASPLTPRDIHELDQYCTERFIELIPNLNTFGHLERWLRHSQYHHLAECPQGWKRPDGYGMPWGSTLTPSPESARFIQSLLDEYLPLFSSSQCNIGGDEPWELGTGRSRERCAREGKQVVYLDFINQIAGLAGAHKQTVQFWADILLEDPSQINQLAPNLIGMIWGYEADHPFEQQCRTMAESGIPFYLVPGTATWNSLGTRLSTALTNIRNAAQYALQYKATGILLTDWGDYGHHQSASLSLPPLYFAAQHFWNPTSEDSNWIEAISRHHFETEDPDFAQALARLGQINQLFQIRPPNRSPLVTILLTHDGRIDEALKTVTPSELEAVASELQEIRSLLMTAPINNKDGETTRAEVILAIEFLLWATDRALLYFQDDLKSLTQQQCNELTELIIRFETLWLQRNRPGGLDESVQRFKRLLQPFIPPESNTALWPPQLEPHCTDE